MHFDFGENLKALRKQKGITQEQAAELLDVSKQSISRWENNITYPDIMFLPALASFYNVTIDYLLGADYETNREIIECYEKERQEAHRKGDIEDPYNLSQKLYASFPNDRMVINNMMTDAYLMGFVEADEKRTHYLELSVSVSERFLKMTDDLEEQCRCIKNIVMCHKLLGNKVKAVDWMNKLPSVWSGIETVASSVLEGKDKTDSISCSLDAVLHLLCRLIFDYAEENSLPKQDRIAALDKLPQILEIIFENGDFGFYHSFASNAFMELVRLEHEDRELVGSYAGKAVDHAKKFDDLKHSIHTSVLFKGHEISPEEFSKANSKTLYEHIAEMLGNM